MLAKKSAVSKAVIHTPKYLSWDLPLNPAIVSMWYKANGGTSVFSDGSCIHDQHKVNNNFLALPDYWKHWSDCKKQYYVLTFDFNVAYNQYDACVRKKISRKPFNFTQKPTVC